MAEYIKKEDVLKLLEKNSITRKITLADGISIYDSVKNAPTADVVEIEKVAEILADITGIAPCEKVGNEWLFDCCEHIGYCCQASDSECWVQYFKHYKERSENDG